VFALAPGISFIDLRFSAPPIATGVYTDSSGVVLIDPGPSSCFETLRQELESRNIGLRDVRTVLLTHIHLDHAGASGTLVRENPAVQIYVHERGAPHVIDPTKLVESATRLWGPMMGMLWGAVLPVPAANVNILRGGERISIGGRQLEVAYTPGHASHHVSYLDRASGVAWVGDTTGIRIGRTRFVRPPTPPPDIDLEAWADSVARIRAWAPGTLFITHFGPFKPVAEHLDEFEKTLHVMAEIARRSLENGNSDDQRFEHFREEFERYIRSQVSEQDAAAYGRVEDIVFSWQGLARYWRKRLATPTSGA
jgi:glyoxylase-like metal-dependent hydrolase (beta-lactamase superfamily II)